MFDVSAWDCGMQDPLLQARECTARIQALQYHYDAGRLRGWKSGSFKMTAPFVFALQARLDLCLHPCCNTLPLPFVKLSAHHIWC